MIELIKKEIHMNRQRGTAVSQLTLDDDFIVPDALDDAVQILLSDGEVQIENSRIQGEKVLIRGKLVFRVLYRRESGGLQAMGGEIPFEETVNVPELSERDYTQIVWNIEDLNITMIHSRKLSAKAVLTLTVQSVPPQHPPALELCPQRAQLLAAGLPYRLRSGLLLLCFIFSQRDFLLPAPLQGIFSARDAAARWCTFPCSKGQQGLYTIRSLFYYTLCMV